MAKKFYVVWAGRETGVFTDWAYTKKQVDKFPQAKYKSFPSEQEAQAAFKAGKVIQGSASQPNVKASTKANTKKQAAPTQNQVATDVKIYCDGACDPNPGESGSGVAVYEKEQLTQLWNGLYSAKGTNNTAELNALHQSLLIAQKYMLENKSVQILCDSQYAINCITNWAFGWKKSSWKRKTGEIKNLAIIQQAHELFNLLSKDLLISHVSAHVGIEGNELADRMAMHASITKNAGFCLYDGALDIDAVLDLKRG
ncbi:MAG: ribonuclease H family protein [Bermanella sp.]